MWTIDQVYETNTNAGYFFFSPETMKSFGDTLSSFKVIEHNGRVYVQRVKPVKGFNGDRVPGSVGEIREFFPDTGRIGSIEACVNNG